mgnify:CR=1 FL=1
MEDYLSPINSKSRKSSRQVLISVRWLPEFLRPIQYNPVTVIQIDQVFGKFIILLVVHKFVFKKTRIRALIWLQSHSLFCALQSRHAHRRNGRHNFQLFEERGENCKKIHQSRPQSSHPKVLNMQSNHSTKRSVSACLPSYIQSKCFPTW